MHARQSWHAASNNSADQFEIQQRCCVVVFSCIRSEWIGTVIVGRTMAGIGILGVDRVVVAGVALECPANVQINASAPTSTRANQRRIAICVFMTTPVNAKLYSVLVKYNTIYACVKY